MSGVVHGPALREKGLNVQSILRCFAVCVWLLVSSTHALAQPNITLLHTQPQVFTVNPAGVLQITYRFKAQAPTAKPLLVFVHFLDDSGAIVFQDDHQPPAATTQWWGDVVYQRTVAVPARVPVGHYRIAIGLYDRKSGVRTSLGTVVDAASEEPSWVEPVHPGSLRYVAGELYVTQKTIVQLPFDCNGNDVTADLARAVRGAAPGQVLRLPRGTCRFGAYGSVNALRLDRRNDVEVVGHGPGSTRLLATDPQRSAFIVYGSTGVLLRDFRLQVERPAGYDQRSGKADAIGVYVEDSRDVELRQLAVVAPLGPGIQFYRGTDSLVTRNFVSRPAADGIHVAGPSSGIVLERNTVFDSGDDALSTIGYTDQAVPLLNENIVIRDNRVRFRDIKWGSGVAVEGSTGVQVTGNRIERSGSAGIRVASIAGYGVLEGVQVNFVTGGVQRVEVARNELVDVETRTNLDHAAIHIAAHSADVSDVLVHDNTISSGSAVATASDAIRIIGSVTPDRIYYVRNTAVWANKIVNVTPGVLGAWCVGRSLATTQNLVLGQSPTARTTAPAPNTYSASTGTRSAPVVSDCGPPADR